MKKILVVDDEPDVAELIGLFLSSLGYMADIFLSCAESMRAVESKRYWAVFCDYMMPKNTGDSLYRKIKDVDRELAKRFVIITGAVLDEKLDAFVKTERIRLFLQGS
ncbi:MAG: response regulator [Nitrospirae bacterium]|nr:response regulator [Nitrospirota bacterium]